MRTKRRRQVVETTPCTMIFKCLLRCWNVGQVLIAHCVSESNQCCCGCPQGICLKCHVENVPRRSSAHPACRYMLIRAVYCITDVDAESSLRGGSTSSTDYSISIAVRYFGVFPNP